MTKPYLEISAFDRLSDVRAKLKRAKEHVTELDREVTSFIESKPYLIKRQLHLQRQDFVVYWIHSTRPIPSAITTRAGDALANIRGALDNLAHALVVVNGQTPRKQTYFPISDDESKYKSEAPGKVKGMSEAATKMIDSCMPYKAGNVRLWQLHKLNNIHKHNTSLSVGMFLEGISAPTFHLLSPTNNIGKILKSGDNLTWFPVKLDTDEFLEFTFQVSLNEPSIISECEPVGETVTDMLALVTRLVNQFKPIL